MDEIKLNELRLHYARMVAKVGGVACSFNATIYQENLPHVRGIGHEFLPPEDRPLPVLCIAQ